MLYRLFLRRKLFKGQFRIFLWLFKYQYLKHFEKLAQPIQGNFALLLNTKNFIDACIYFTGDYESYLKIQYKKLIKPGDTILDVGANIGFHSLYFAELTGSKGKVFSFEPIHVNYTALLHNLSLNNFLHIMPQQIALGNENATLAIHLDQEQENPGAFNLWTNGAKNYSIQCEKGDDFLIKKNINKVNFIKIDVEGYEYEVLKGLKNTIDQSRPIINFEYDKNYQSINNNDPLSIFHFLKEMNYTFYKIDGYGNAILFNYLEHIETAEVIAFP